MTTSTLDDDGLNRLMDLALDQARIALTVGEVPVGCVVVGRDGAVLAQAYNQTVASRNATRHCELIAIESLLRSSSSPSGPISDLSACSLFVTCEPCIMCASLLTQVGLGNVFFGCCNDRFGGIESLYQIDRDDDDVVMLRTAGGVRRDEAVALLRAFYEGGNPSAPEAKRARTRPSWRCQDGFIVAGDDQQKISM